MLEFLRVAILTGTSNEFNLEGVCHRLGGRVLEFTGKMNESFGFKRD